MIAAAGNDNLGTVLYPASSPLVVAVSGLQRDVPEPVPSVADPGLPQDLLDERWASSNYGDGVEIAAPAAEIFTALTTDASSMGVMYGYATGTSLAVPFVSGAAALAWAMDPSMGASTLRSKLQETATDMGAPGMDPQFGHGKLNAEALLASM
jgi:subtilisin family serine protease